MKNRGLVFAIAVIVFALLTTTVFVVWQSAFCSSKASRPNPNGYDDFAAAVKLLQGEPGDFPEMDLTELRELVDTNAPALQRARKGLAYDCLFPDNYSASFIEDNLEGQMGLKKLGNTFRAEAQLALLEQRTNAAAQSCLDTIQFGQKCCRGGVIFTRLVGTAIEIIGMRGLASMASGADAKLCREVVNALESATTNSESAAATIRQERIWRWQTYGLKGQFQSLFEFKELSAVEKSVPERLTATSLERNKLLMKFAARAYELEQGKRPAKAADLVQTYLKAVPQDPATGKALELTP